MNKLLHWSIENKQDDEKIDVSEIDPKWIDIILGKTSSVYVNEQLEEIRQSSIEKQREILTNLEEYCWDLDNANSVQDWRFLMELQHDNDLKDVVYSLFGTILQNNEQAQKIFVNNVDWTMILQDLHLNQKVLDKVFYCLCSILPSFEPARDEFSAIDGYARVLELLDKGINHKKVIYFLKKNLHYVKTTPQQLELIQSS